MRIICVSISESMDKEEDRGKVRSEGYSGIELATTHADRQSEREI